MQLIPSHIPMAAAAGVTAPAAEEPRQQQKHQMWEGKATAKLKQLTAEQVWPLLEDFCSFDKWLPTIDTCRHLEGVNGEPGVVRYCSTSITIAPTNDDVKGGGGGGSEEEEEKKKEEVVVIKWCHEKLVAIDPVVRCLTYEILNNNLGFNSYVSTIRVLPLLQPTYPPPPAKDDGDGEDDGGGGFENEKLGCEIEWSILADPVDGLTCEGLLSYLDNSLQGIAENMEKSLLQSSDINVESLLVSN